MGKIYRIKTTTKILISLCCCLLFFSSVTNVSGNSDQQEAIQQTEDEWQAVRQTMQQSKVKFDAFYENYQDFKEAAFNIDAEIQIEQVRKAFKLDKKQTKKLKNKLATLRDMYDELDRNGLQAKLEDTSKALEFADSVAGKVDDVWQFTKKFNPENAEDNPTYGLRLIGDLLKEGAEKMKEIPIVGEVLGSLVSAYAEAAGDYANALDRLDKKIENFRGGSICGQIGKKVKQKKAFAAASLNDEDCQTYLAADPFPHLIGEVYEGNGSYFLYSPSTERGYFSPIGATVKIYQWSELLLRHRTLEPDWLSSRARSISPKVESRARDYYSSFSGWESKMDPGSLLIEKLGLVREADFYGILSEEQFVANYIIDKDHHDVIENVMTMFKGHVLLSGTVYEQKDGEETPSAGTVIEITVGDQFRQEQTDQSGGYAAVMAGKIGDTVHTKLSKDGFTTIEREGRMYRQVVVGEKYTLREGNLEMSVSVPTQENELNELRALRDRAIQLGSSMCSASESANAKKTFIDEKSSSIQDQIKAMENDLHGALKTLNRLDQVGGNIKSTHGLTERLTTNIADASSLAEEKRAVTCQAAAAMNQSKTNRERDQYYAQAYSSYTEVKATFEKARVDFRQIGTERDKIKDDRDPLLRAKQLTEAKGTIPAELLTAGNEVNSARQEIDTLLETARGNLTQLETVVSSAESLSAQINQSLNPKAGGGFLTAVKELGRKKSAEEVALKKIMKQISTQLKSSKKCLKKIEKVQRSVRQRTDKFNLRFAELEKKLSRLQQAFLPGIDGQLSEPLKNSLEQLGFIDLLANMGRGYLDRCMEQLLKARLCMNDAEQLSTIAFSAAMPRLRGETCQKATGILNNYNYQVVSAGKATHPDWEYCVKSTDPPEGAEISRSDSSILITCYEELDIPAYLASVDCSAYNNSSAVFNQTTRQAGCDCTDGLIWGKSRQRCIDCTRYENGVRNAFNAGDFNTAQSLATEASSCSWSASALSQINGVKQQQVCSELEGKMQAAYMANDARAASGFWRQADELNCSLDPGLVQGVSNIIRRYNEMGELQAEAEAQRQRDEAQIAAQQSQQSQPNLIGFANSLLSGVKAAQEGNTGGGSAPAVPSSLNFGDLGNRTWTGPNGAILGGRDNTGSSGSGGKATGTCSGHTLYCKSRPNLRWEVHKTGYRSLDRNHDGICDICKLRIIAPNDCRSSPWKPKQN